MNRSCIAVQRLAWAVQTELIRMRVLFTWLKSTSINVPGIKKNTFFAIQRPNHTQNYNEASICFHKGNGPVYFYLCTFIFDIVCLFFFFWREPTKSSYPQNQVCGGGGLGSEKVVVTVISGSATHGEIILLYKISFPCFTNWSLYHMFLSIWQQSTVNKA